MLYTYLSAIAIKQIFRFLKLLILEDNFEK